MSGKSARVVQRGITTTTSYAMALKCVSKLIFIFSHKWLKKKNLKAKAIYQLQSFPH